MQAENTPNPKRNKQNGEPERQRLVQTYRMVVQSVREAGSVQTVIEKEQQMRRLMRYLRRGMRPATP